MIEIPYQSLSAGALVGVIDTFVLREGTDYGHRDIDLDEKRDRVLKMLQAGHAIIRYFPENEHIEIELV
ncbi:MAG: YheU family protein [Pseudomonadales bacterium]|jgi:uncharacterized protein|nr:YheU family protein [Pseudomonadales bacterium]